MSGIDWSKSQPSDTHYDTENRLFVNFDAMQDWNRKLVARPSPAWSGEGLPPVGTACQINGTVLQELKGHERSWRKVEIIAHTHFGGVDVAVGRDLECATLGWGTPAVFRPIPAWSGEGETCAASELTQLADKYLSYCPETGILLWKDNQQKRFIGREAGFITHHGYRRVNLGKTQIHAHQLIWLMVYGYLPDCEIDHVNGSRDDNRIDNLRLATTQQNQQNTGVRVDNVLGIKGVRLRPSGRYQARVSLTDGSRLTKTFKTCAEAVCWLAKQREDSHGDFANTPEQIAADERHEAVMRMSDIVGGIEKVPSWTDAIEALYDAGLRFSEQPK
jgi:hypothetical protein